MPGDSGDFEKIRTLLAGTELGEIRKNRFVPSHHLCKVLKKEDFKRTVSFEKEDLCAYFRGESVFCDGEKGFGAVLYADKFPVGWYKYSDGCAKNHYPKYLRG